MAVKGGPLQAYSRVPITADRVFTSVFIGDGANAHREEGMGVEASGQRKQ